MGTSAFSQCGAALSPPNPEACVLQTSRDLELLPPGPSVRQPARHPLSRLCCTDLPAPSFLPFGGGKKQMDTVTLITCWFQTQARPLGPGFETHGAHHPRKVLGRRRQPGLTCWVVPQPE